MRRAEVVGEEARGKHLFDGHEEQVSLVSIDSRSRLVDVTRHVGEVKRGLNQIGEVCSRGLDELRPYRRKDNDTGLRGDAAKRADRIQPLELRNVRHDVWGQLVQRIDTLRVAHFNGRENCMTGSSVRHVIAVQAKLPS